MNTRRLFLAGFALSGLLFQSCNEPDSGPISYESPTPPVQLRTPVHLAVGNKYNWRVTQVGIGTFLQWNELFRITDDTTLNGRVHFVFDSGELLASHGDTVFAHTNGSTTVHYRVDVAVGDTVPFIGYMFRVTDVDTEAVLGENQTVVTVSNEFASATSIASARYASRFGLIRIVRSDPLHGTTSSLVGARLGATTYGAVP